MKRLLLWSVISILFTILNVTPAFAQATAGSKLGFDVTAPDITTALAYTYKYYPDAATTGITLTTVACTGAASPFQCQAPFPAFTPGVTHTLTVTASNAAGESPKSAPLSFTFVAIPNAPTNLKIQ